jgi:hypothetical protein
MKYGSLIQPYCGQMLYKVWVNPVAVVTVCGSYPSALRLPGDARCRMMRKTFLWFAGIPCRWGSIVTRR